jgi:hypothetical protein
LWRAVDSFFTSLAKLLQASVLSAFPAIRQNHRKNGKEKIRSSFVRDCGHERAMKRQISDPKKTPVFTGAWLVQLEWIVAYDELSGF